MPFETSDGYNPDWWDRRPRGEDPTWVVLAAVRDGDEVGRVKLVDRKMWLTESYGVDPQVATIALEIRFIEVASAYRRQRIGTEIVRALVQRHPSRRLAAFSTDADDFWTKLEGGKCYEHLEQQTPPNRLLFIADAA